MLQVGDLAPNFVLPSSQGGQVELQEAVHSGAVVLHFYPLAFTGG